MKKLKLLLDKFLVFFKIKKAKLEPCFGRVNQLPYVVIVENTSDKTIENVSLFFANNQNELAFSSDGSYRENGLVISSGIADVTYNHISKNFVTQKTNIWITYIQSENQKQIIENFSIKQQDANGTSAVKVLTPKKDPCQQQQNIVAVKENYSLDGNTAIIIHKVQPKTTLKMYFYPQIKSDDKK